MRNQNQIKLCPPSIKMFAPVMKELLSEAKNRTALDTSSILAILRNGKVFSRFSRIVDNCSPDPVAD